MSDRDRQPESALDVVRAGFSRLADRLVYLREHAVPGLPEPLTCWGRLREVLLDPGVPLATIDAVWVRLVQRTRASGGDGNAAVVCAGMALPMLVSVASRLAGPWQGDCRDIDSAVLSGFLTALPTVDLDRRAVLHRLRWAAYRSGLAWIEREQQAPAPVGVVGDQNRTPSRKQVEQRSDGGMLARSDRGHPELVLAEAVADGVISSEAARLIAVTRLQRRSLTAVASEHAQPYKRLHSVRRRAEHRLAAWLADRAVDLNPDRCSEVEIQVLRTEHSLLRRRTAGPAESRQRRVPKNTGGSGVRARGKTTTPIPAHTLQEVRKCA